MNNIQTKKESLLPLRDITDLVNIPTIVLSEKVIAQISYYHHKVKGSEWSGPLIYSRTGADDILKLFKEGSNETMEFKAEDILIADIGTPGFTSYKLDEPTMMTRVQDYQLSGYHLGHSHSHQSMPTYFSGTDNEELQENTPNHKMYVSLIVNYKDGGEFTARVCCKTTEKVSIGDYLKNLTFFNKKRQEVDLSDIFTEREVIYYINIPVTYGLDKLTLDRYDAVVEEKKPKPIETYFPNGYGRGFDNRYGGGAAGWSRGNQFNKQLSIYDFNDAGELIEDKPIEIEEDSNFGLSITRVNLLDYLYRIFSLDLDITSAEIDLPTIHILFKDINTKYSKIQLEDIEGNLENMTEYIIETVWGNGKSTFVVDDEQMFEVVEEANHLLKKEFSEYKRVVKLFDDYYVFVRGLMLEELSDVDSPFVDTKLDSYEDLVINYSKNMINYGR